MKFDKFQLGKKLKLTLVVFGVSFFVLSSWKKAQAAIYYIDPTCFTPGNGTSGDCSGTSSDPFDQWSSVTWNAGNTYLQKGGTTAKIVDLNPQQKIINIKASGTAENPISIGSYGTGKAKIYGGITIPIDNWNVDDPIAGIYSYATLWGALLLWEDDVPLKNATDSTCSDGNWFADSSKIYYKPTSGSLLDHVIEQYHLSGVDTNDYNYITIDGLDFDKVFYGVINNPGSSVNNATHIAVTNSSFRNIPRGVFFENANSVDASIMISNNTFDYVGVSVMIGGTGQNDGVDIFGNTITNCSQAYGATNHEWADAISSPHVKDTEGIGVQDLINSDIYDNSITGICRGIYNYAHGGRESRNVNIYGNYISTGRAGMIFAPSQLTSAYYNINVHSNVLEKCGELESMTNNSAIFIRPPNAPTNNNWNNLYNNTIVDSTYGIFILPYSGYHDMYWNVKNNIIWNSVNSHVYEINSPMNIVYDRNLYYPDKSNAFFASSANRTFAQWRAIDSRDANSPIPANPFFVSSSDFHLQSTSPAINAAVNVELTTDFDGNSIIGAPDIGAYEFQGDVVAPFSPSQLNIL